MKAQISLFCLILGCSEATVDEPQAEAGSTSASTSDETSASASEAASTSTSTSTSGTGSGEASSSSADSTGAGSEASGTDGCLDAEFPIPAGTPVTVDGVAGDEWGDAQAFMIAPEADWVVPIGIKHDGDALLFVFADLQPASPPPFAFPELMLDIGNDKATMLGPDDWWFHVSATDCAATGTYDDYTGCVAEGEGWEANNFPPGSLIDLVEIRIELQTVGIEPTAAADIGILLRLSDTQGFAAHWPAAASPDDPSTWATVRYCP